MDVGLRNSMCVEVDVRRRHDLILKPMIVGGTP